MQRRGWVSELLGVTVVGLALSGLGGCVKAPERIEVNVGGGRPDPVDPARVPQPATLPEAQAELDRAYQNIQWLEQENARLRRKADEYKRERDDARKRLERYEDD